MHGSRMGLWGKCMVESKAWEVQGVVGVKR